MAMDIGAIGLGLVVTVIAQRISRRVVLIAWVVDSVAIAWLFGYIMLFGNDPDGDRVALAGNLGAIWGVLTLSGAWKLWRAKREQIQTSA